MKNFIVISLVFIFLQGCASYLHCDNHMYAAYSKYPEHRAIFIDNANKRCHASTNTFGYSTKQAAIQDAYANCNSRFNETKNKSPKCELYAVNMVKSDIRKQKDQVWNDKPSGDSMMPIMQGLLMGAQVANMANGNSTGFTANPYLLDPSLYSNNSNNNKINHKSKTINSTKCTLRFSTTSMTERTGFFALGTTNCPNTTEQADISYSYTFEHTLGGGGRNTVTKNIDGVVNNFNNNNPYVSGTISNFSIDNTGNIKAVEPKLISVSVKDCTCNYKQNAGGSN